MPTPLPETTCKFCHDNVAQPVPIRVAYATSGVADPVPMWRVQCPCGAIGKCRRTPEEAVASWDEPWQAFVSPEIQDHKPSPELSRPAERGPRWPRGHASDEVVSAIEAMRERVKARDDAGLDTWPAGYAASAVAAHEEALAQCAEPKPSIDWMGRWMDVERLLHAGDATNGVRSAFALLFNWMREGR